MHYMKKIGIVVFFLAFISNRVNAQTVHGNPNVWLFNLTQFKLNDKLNLANELHFRYDEFLSKSQQLLIRPYIDYKFNDKLVGSFGYTYILTRPYGDYPLLTDKPEHNVWEQITVKNKINQWKLAHRFRLENRWSGSIDSTPTNGEYKINGYNFSNRFRYRLTLKRNLGDAYYIHLFNELWIKEKNKFKSISFDRNWIYAGFGWKVTPVLGLELAYMHQYIQNNPTLYERHHTILATLKLDLKK